MTLVFARRSILLLLLLYSLPLLAPHETVNYDGVPWEFAMPKRIVAIGDVHADPRMLISVLKKTRLIDPDGHWSGGKAHLVLMGDLVDQGPDSRAVLDLVMQLEKEALAAEGYVHALVGNHDVMVTEGVTKYATDSDLRGYEDFQGTPAARHIRQQHPSMTYHQSAYYAAFVGDTKYADFLRRRNSVIRIGDTVFAHGGLGEWATKVDMGKLNATVRAGIRANQDASLGRTDELRLTREQQWVMSGGGPFWDRDMAEGRLTQKEVEEILFHLNVKRATLGHTITDSKEIEKKYKGLVYLIDTGGSVGKEGFPSALEIVGKASKTQVSEVPYYETREVKARNKIPLAAVRSCERALASLRTSPDVDP